MSSLRRIYLSGNMFQCHCSLRGIQNIIQNEDKLSGFVVQDGHIYMNYYRDDTDSGTTIDVVYENTSKVMPVKGKRSVVLSLTQPGVDECQILVGHHTNASCWAGNLSKAEVETDKILVKLLSFPVPLTTSVLMNPSSCLQ